MSLGEAGPTPAAADAATHRGFREKQSATPHCGLSVTRVLAGSLSLTMFLSARLLDLPEFEGGHSPLIFVVFKYPLAVPCRLARKPEGFIAELITAHREVVAVAERALLCAGGATAQKYAQTHDCFEGGSHRPCNGAQPLW